MTASQAPRAHNQLVVWWWVAALGTLLVPPLVVVAFTLGAVTAFRGRGGEGARMMLLALLALFVAFALR